MGLLNAGSCGWCLRWPATVSRAVHGQVVDERHRRCALVSTRGPGDGAEFLTACRQKAGRSVGRWRPGVAVDSFCMIWGTSREEALWLQLVPT